VIGSQVDPRLKVIDRISCREFQISGVESPFPRFLSEHVSPSTYLLSPQPNSKLTMMCDMSSALFGLVV
jgi:hypothetical protein